MFLRLKHKLGEFFKEESIYLNKALGHVRDVEGQPGKMERTMDGLHWTAWSILHEPTAPNGLRTLLLSNLRIVLVGTSSRSSSPPDLAQVFEEMRKCRVHREIFIQRSTFISLSPIPPQRCKFRVAVHPFFNPIGILDQLCFSWPRRGFFLILLHCSLSLCQTNRLSQ